MHFGGAGSARSAPPPRAGQKVVLKSQRESVAPDAFLASHYDRACNQFREMIGNSAALGGSAVVITSVEYYGFENSPMQTRFDAAKLTFQQKNKDDKEVWVFHGTKTEAAISSIMTGGFKVGGQDVPVAVGTAYGQGVYSACGPSTPMGYGQATKAVILAKALPGACRGGHETGGGDSWRPNGDWYIFKKSEQVMPCYVVRLG